jgi:predicted Zn-dependent protease
MTAAERQALLDRAAKLADDKRWPEAADALVGAPTDDYVLDKRVWYLSRAKRYDEALEICAELRERRPTDFRPCYMTGFQYYDQHLFAQALPWFEEALGRHPAHIRSWWRKARALSVLGNRDAARSAAGKVLHLYRTGDAQAKERERETFGKACFLLGKDALDGDPFLAVELLKQAQDVDPRDPNRRYQYAKSLRMTGHPDAAIELLGRAQKHAPADIYAAIELGVCLTAVGRSQDAERLLARIAPRCRGWQAYRAAQLAARIGVSGRRLELLERAAKDRDTKTSERVRSALENARRAASAVQASSPTVSDLLAGRVININAKGRFGFLRDESGATRYFRLTAGQHLRKGIEVCFRPINDDARGPAADVVRSA